MGAKDRTRGGATAQRWRLFLPLFAIGSIVAIAAALLTASRVFERERQEHRLISDSLWAEQAVNFEIQRAIESLQQLGRNIVDTPAGAADFRLRGSAAMQRSPEITRIVCVHCVDASRRALPSAEGGTNDSLIDRTVEQAAERAHKLGAATAVYLDPPGRADVVLALPADSPGMPGAVVVAVISLQRLLANTIPWWFAHETQISLDDSTGRTIAIRDVNVKGVGVYKHRIASQFADQTIYLSTDSTRDTPLLVPNLLTLSVICLSLLLAWTVYALWRDLSLRTAAEAALREQRAFQLAMENSLVTGLRARDLDGCVTYVNPAFCEMVGYSRDELVGRSPPMQYWAPEVHGPAQDRHEQRLAGTLPTLPYESAFVRRDGRRLDVVMHEAPLLDGSGRQTGWMASILDVSEQKRSAEFHREQNEKMHRMSRLMTMGEMGSALAHELNQPLAAITSYVSAGLNTLAAAAPDGRVEKAMAMFAKAKLQTERAGGIIRRVRQFVQKSGPALLPIDLQDTIADVLPLVRLQIASGEERLVIDVPDDMPQVVSDRILLQQILLNLIKNGFEAMAHLPPPERVVVVSARQVEASGAVMLRVRDRGPGLGAQAVALMTTSFTTTKAEGMGLGLAVCRTALELMGSRLNYVESNGQAVDGDGGKGGDGGAEFSFQLRIHTSRVPLDVEETAAI